MPSLVDIAPLAEKVVIRGDEFEVRGLDVDSIAYLFQRFPGLVAKIREWSNPLADKTGPESIIALGPKLVAAIVATCLGKMGDEAEEIGAGNLSLQEKMDVLSAMIRLTAPGGVVPFVVGVVRVLGVSPADFPASLEDGKALVTSSRRQSKS